jgi:hypothetical protein
LEKGKWERKKKRESKEDGEEQEVAGRWSEIEESARKGREFGKEWEEKESTGRKYGGN